MPRPDSYDGNGMTLVELMVVMVVSTLLMAAVYAAYLTQHKTSHVQHQVGTMQQDLRAAIDIMERDIRTAGCDPLGTAIAGAGGLAVSTGPASIRVLMDIDESGAILSTTTGIDEDVRYTYSNNAILRNNQINNQIIAQDISNMALNYNTGTGGNINSVDITIQVQTEQIDPDTGNHLTRTLTRRVRCRNIGL